jgi:hypothetical protein
VPPWLVDLFGIVLMLVGIIAVPWLLFTYDARLGFACIAAAVGRGGLWLATRTPQEV